MRAVHDPLEHAHVFAEARPDEFAVGVFAEPVHMEDARRLAQRSLHLDPVAEIVAHVVTAERQHRHRIAAHLADRSRSRGRRFRAHGRARIDAGAPVEGLVNQRHGGRAASAENDGADRHAVGIFPRRIDGRALRSRRGEARIGMRGLRAGALRDLRASTSCPASRDIRRAARPSCLPTRRRLPASARRW